MNIKKIVFIAGVAVIATGAVFFVYSAKSKASVEKAEELAKTPSKWKEICDTKNPTKKVRDTQNYYCERYAWHLFYKHHENVGKGVNGDKLTDPQGWQKDKEAYCDYMRRSNIVRRSGSPVDPVADLNYKKFYQVCAKRR